MKISRITLYTLALLVAASVTGCSGKKKTDTREAMTVSVAYPVVDSVTVYKSYPGFLWSHWTVDIVCQVNGRLLTKNYKSGDFVRQGQLLFTIDPTLYRDQVSEAEAQLATARSSFDYYSKQYDAMNRALQADAVSQMDVIQARSNMERARASIQEAQAALNTARTNLSYCTIRAPKDGYITSAALDPGNYVAGAGSPMKLATIYDNDHMVVSFDVEGADYDAMLAVSQDTSVYIPLRFQAPMEHEYKAHLYYIDPSVKRTTGTVTLKGMVPNTWQELKNAMYVTCMLPAQTNPKAILVRDASISRDQQGAYLYTVNDSNKVIYTPVEVGGIYQDTLRMVTKGVTPRTRYVTSALLKVRDGMTVNPVVKK